jgi:hypothetical protein
VGKAEWAGIIGALCAALVAVITALSAMQEHGPGIVTGLLLGAAAMGIVVFLIFQLKTLTQEALVRAKEQSENDKQSALVLQDILGVLEEMVKRDSLAQVLANLNDKERQQVLDTASAIAAAKVADAAVVAAKVVTDKAEAVAEELRDVK